MTAPPTADRMRCVATCAHLGGELLVALAAVEQMPAHGGARLRHGAGADRLQDLRGAPLEQSRGRRASAAARAAANRLARNDEAAEILQEAAELRIAGGVGDRAMKARSPDRRRSRRARCAASMAPAGSRRSCLSLRRRGALGGEAGGLDLDAGAQLHDVEHFAQRRKLRRSRRGTAGAHARRRRRRRPGG